MVFSFLSHSLSHILSKQLVIKEFLDKCKEDSLLNPDSYNLFCKNIFCKKNSKKNLVLKVKGQISTSKKGSSIHHQSQPYFFSTYSLSDKIKQSEDSVLWELKEIDKQRKNIGMINWVRCIKDTILKTMFSPL